MIRRLLIATTNPGKLREILPILELPGLDLLTLPDYPDLSAPSESGTSFAENARLKAGHYAAGAGVLTVAEDSGLEIEALGGDPGVQSARFTGDTYEEKFAEIYRRLARSGQSAPSARFVCAVALADARGCTIFETEGVVEGSIALSPRGDRGFGYDPIFYYPPYRRTLAELAPDEKAAVSHRGLAFRQLRQYLSLNPDIDS